jgi:hypothetical protein
MTKEPIPVVEECDHMTQKDIVRLGKCTTTIYRVELDHARGIHEQRRQLLLAF